MYCKHKEKGVHCKYNLKRKRDVLQTQFKGEKGVYCKQFKN